MTGFNFGKKLKEKSAKIPKGEVIASPTQQANQNWNETIQKMEAMGMVIGVDMAKNLEKEIEADKLNIKKNAWQRELKGPKSEPEDILDIMVSSVPSTSLLTEIDHLQADLKADAKKNYQQRLMDDIEAEASKEWDPMELLLEAVHSLRSVCDGATSDDTMGFAGMHVHHGHRIAATPRNMIVPNDVLWMGEHLQYYKNTQLTWVPWDKWQDMVAKALVEADQNLVRIKQEEEAERKKEYEREEKINAIPYKQARLLFVSIDRSQVEKKDLSFLVNLQTQSYRHTEKQEAWLYKFLAKYWDAVKRAGKDDIFEAQETEKKKLLGFLTEWEQAFMSDEYFEIYKEVPALLSRVRNYLKTQED